jgi:hypothetical protein
MIGKLRIEMKTEGLNGHGTVKDEGVCSRKKGIEIPMIRKRKSLLLEQPASDRIERQRPLRF